MLKPKTFLTQRPCLIIICIKEDEESQLKAQENIFNTIINETFPNLKEMTISIYEA